MALVGGAGGIGRCLARSMLEIGLKVVVLDLEIALSDFGEPSVLAKIAIDAMDENSVRAGFAEVEAAFGGRLDGLVNLVGFANRHVSFDQLSSAEWDEVLNGNLRSAWLSCRAALPMLQRSRGAIVNVASGLAVRPMAGFASYAAAKAGLIALTKTIALEAAPRVRANVVAPGAVETAFHTGGTGRPQDPPDAPPRLDREAYSRMVPLGRIATPEDIVGPVLFLLGPTAAFITGQTLHVNGGGLMP